MATQVKKASDKDRAMLNNLLHTTLPQAEKIIAPVQRVVPVIEEAPVEAFKQINLKIPEEMKKKWDQYCVENDCFMKDLIMDAVEAKIRR